jgi:geranylgeranyl pyrophosphate synthase
VEQQLKDYFSEITALVDQKLDALIPSAEVEPQFLHEAIRWSVFAGGKRFRPALVLAVGQVFGAAREKLLRTAAAVEMIHTYSLIHDDLPDMDNDDWRRGRATCHKKFGSANAILAGDVLQTLAFQAVSEDKNLPAEIRVKLISELSRAAGTPNGMVAGQVFDLEAEKKAVTGAELERIHRSKTGAMILVSARSGALIAEAEELDLEAISEYAAALGLLFQITDDLLDVTATTEDLGKTAGKDEIAEKATYPKLYGLEKARQMAVETHARTCAALEKIKQNTGILRDIADFILTRRN